MNRFLAPLIGASQPNSQATYNMTIGGAPATIGGTQATRVGAFENLQNDIYGISDDGPTYQDFPVAMDFLALPFKSPTGTFGNAAIGRVGVTSTTLNHIAPNGYFDGPGWDALTSNGTNPAYTPRIYDKSGNGYDAVQGTEANQPLLLRDGTVVFSSGKSMKASGFSVPGSNFAIAAVIGLDSDSTYPIGLLDDLGNQINIRFRDDVNRLQTTGTGLSGFIANVPQSTFDDPYFVFQMFITNTGCRAFINTTEATIALDANSAMNTVTDIITPATGLTFEGKQRLKGVGAWDVSDVTDIYNWCLDGGFLNA